MKNSVKKSLIIEILLVVASILNFIFPIIFNHDKQIIFLIIALLITYFAFGINLKRNANDKEIMKNILIYLFIYYILIYLSGLYIGFARTIYSYTISNFINNVIPLLITIVLVEILRNQLINKTNKDKIVVITSAITFVIFEASVNFHAYTLTVKDDIYKYIGLIILASISKNILMTILNTRTDYLPGIMYRLIMEELIYLVLIVPNMGPYLESVALIILPILIAFMIMNSQKRLSKPKDKKRVNKIYIVVTAILLVLVLLNSGLMRYQIMVIGSNSMKNYMEKGDVIFLERLKGKEKNELKEKEILVFRYDGKIISHRITKRIERPDQVYYRTKGDNNNQEDNAIIDNDKVIGKVLFRIKSVGLPSVWLSELFD